MKQDGINVGVIGTGQWTIRAHLPAFERCKNAKVTAICDPNLERAQEVANRFGIPEAYSDHFDLLDNSDIDMIDISTSTPLHFPLALDTIESGKPILCEKPIAMTYKDARRLYKKATAKGVKTKVAFSHRESPVIRQMKKLIDEGFIGIPYHFNGFEQNSQFINPMTPFRWNPGNDPEKIIPGSLEEYGSHLIDLARWLMGDLKAVVGHMKNFIPERMIRDHGKVMPINIEDGCVFLGEFQNEAQATFQTSFIAIEGYPGIEIHVYGSKGALKGRVVYEKGSPEILKTATPNNVEFVPVEIPAHFYGNAKTSIDWIHVRFGNLVQRFVDAILNNQEPNGTFYDGMKCQEVETAVALSHQEKQWITLPLDEKNLDII